MFGTIAIRLCFARVFMAIFKTFLVWVLLLAATSSRAAGMPELQALGAADMPQACGCEFGRERGKTLLYWPQDESKAAFIREPGGVRKLRMFSEKYLPERRDPPKAGDRQALMFSDGSWHIQAVGEVTQACSAKARQCGGVVLRNRLVVQWEGREKTEIDGWGRCGCRK